MDNKIITEKTLGTQSDSNTLAQLGIVKAQDSEVAYRLDDSVLRQEVVGMAMKVGKFELPDDYACQRVFADVSATKPNSWACRVIEIAAEKSIISAVNKSFRPMATITRAEALAILLKAANITITESATSHFRDVTVPWQISVINTAFTAGYIDDMTEFRPTEEATRGEIFAMARRILRK